MKKEPSKLTHAEISAKGGRSGRGKVKTRTKAHYRAAAKEKWRRFYEVKNKTLATG